MRAAMSGFAVAVSVSGSPWKVAGRTSSRLNTSSPVRTVSNSSHCHCGDTSGRWLSRCSSRTTVRGLTGRLSQVPCLVPARDHLAEPWDTHEDGGDPSLLLDVELVELLLRCGEAGGEPFDFGEPALALGFGDPVGEVVPDLYQPRPFCWGDEEDRASDAPLTERTVGIGQFRGRMLPAVATVTGRDGRCARAGPEDVGGSSVGTAGGDR